MTDDERLRHCFDSLKAEGRQAQLRRCTVKTVDRSRCTIDVLGESDGLEYYDVTTGLGACIMHPKPGSACLIAIIEGQETDAFLVAAEELELAEVTAEEIVFNGGSHGGLVKSKEVAKHLNAMENDINQLKQALSRWKPVPNDGGAALKGFLSGYAESRLSLTKVEDIENKAIRQ